jgi:hypothetical protein
MAASIVIAHISSPHDVVSINIEVAHPENAESRWVVGWWTRRIQIGKQIIISCLSWLIRQFGVLKSISIQLRIVIRRAYTEDIPTNEIFTEHYPENIRVREVYVRPDEVLTVALGELGRAD